MPDKKPVSSKAMRRYTRFGLPVDNPVARDATSVVIPSVTPQEREAASYYNPPVKDVSSGDAAQDFLYRNQWLMRAPVVGSMIKGMAYRGASNSGGAPVVNQGESSDGRYTGSLHDNAMVKPVDMLGVYFGKNTLPKATYKPTSDYLEFLPTYSVKGDFDANDKSMKGFGVVVDKVLKDIPDFGKKLEEMKSGGDPVYVGNSGVSSLSAYMGLDLGSHKTGIGYDSEAGLPYISLSDAWDFEPRHYAEKWDDGSNKDKAYVQSSLMHKAGNPFKIYDRFYFDPETKEYIPDSEVASRKK